MSSEMADRAWVQSRLDSLGARLDQARASMTAELDRYRDDLDSSMAEINREHAARMQAIRDESLQRIKSLAGQADEPGPAQDAPAVRPGESGASLSALSGSSVGDVPPGRQEPIITDLQRAQEIADMDMTTYAKLRGSLGVRSNTSMEHLFGVTR